MACLARTGLATLRRSALARAALGLGRVIQGPAGGRERRVGDLLADALEHTLAICELGRHFKRVHLAARRQHAQ